MPGGSLDAAHFEMAMRQQLRQYAGRRLSDYLAHGCAGEAERTQASTFYSIQRVTEPLALVQVRCNNAR